MMAKDGSVFHCGPIALTFASGVIEYISSAEIRPMGSVIKAPACEDTSGSCDISVLDRGIAVYVKTPAQTPQNVAAHWGLPADNITYNSDGSVIVNFDSANTDTDKGAASVSGRLKNGRYFRFYVKRAAKYGAMEAIAMGKAVYSNFAYMLESLDPADGTTVPFRYEEGIIA
jgi:hypothetical protein